VAYYVAVKVKKQTGEMKNKSGNLIKTLNLKRFCW
jgi:hypothetical protein